MKDDERLLPQKLRERGPIELDLPSAWDIAQSIGMHYKRARYILRKKWPSKGWYEYGISWRAGWLEDEGLE